MTGPEFDRKAHWERVYSTRRAEQTSWYQPEPRLSLDLIGRSGVDRAAPLVDIGGGASTLVDCLLDRGFGNLTVLDVSSAALEQARNRLGEKAARVNWIEADVTGFRAPGSFALWHDRAVFHFLTHQRDRERYLESLDRGLDAGGTLVISTFSLDGPEKCSGLKIVRYDALMLAEELGDRYRLEEQAGETHITPAGGEQRFGFYRFLKVA